MVEIILASFPEYIKVSELPHDDINFKVSILFVFLLVYIVVFGMSQGQFTETTYKQETDNNKNAGPYIGRPLVGYRLTVGWKSSDISAELYRRGHL